MPERKLIDLDQAHQVTAPNGTVYNVKVKPDGTFYTEAATEGIGVQAEALWKASSYSGSGQFLNDLSGNGHHLRLGSTQPAYVAQGTLNLPGVGGNFASMPSFTLSNDIDIRARIEMPSWTTVTRTIVSRWNTGGYSFLFQVANTGHLKFHIMRDGIGATETTSTVIAGGEANIPLWVRVTRNATTGNVTFYTGANNTSWTQLGSVISSVTGSAGILGTTPWMIGSHDAGAGNPFSGKILYCEIRGGIDGTVAAKFDPSGQADHTTSWYSETGEQWTITSTSGTDTNEPKFLKYEGTNYLYLPGVVGNYASVPDENSLDITGDLDVRIKVQLDDWTPSTQSALISKRGAPGQRSWSFQVLTTGQLYLLWSEDGSLERQIISSGAAIAEGTTLWLRATLDVNNGSGGHEVKFWKSGDYNPDTNSGAWEQVGSTMNAGAFTTSIFNSSASLNIGANVSGSEALSGKVYRAIVRNVVNDQTVLDIDFSKATSSSTTFTAETGQTVTINRATSGLKSVTVDRSLFLFGTDDYMEAPDHPDLDFGATDSFSLVVVRRRWGNAASSQALLYKKGDWNSSYAGYAMDDEGGGGVSTRIADGANGVSSQQSSSPSGTLDVLAAVRNTSTDNHTLYKNGTSTATNDTLTNMLRNGYPLQIGKRGNATNHPDMEFIGAAIFRRALTETEVALLAGEFGA